MPPINDSDVFSPSPEEIQAACQEIQAEWSEDERLRRARGVLVCNKGAREEIGGEA